MSDTQRKAWNEAMRSAGAVVPGATVPAVGGPTSRRGAAGGASRRRRRDKARKSSAHDAAGGGASSLEEKEYRVALHMDMLEGVTAAPEGDDDEEYDEFEELDDDDDGGKKAKKRKRGRGGGGKKAASSVPKYLKARSLASILIEEAGRSDSVAKQYVDASVKKLGSGATRTQKEDKGKIVTTYTNPHPQRKFCPVTGLLGEHTDPKTGIPYASLAALEQIRERAPPWMGTGNAGSASYWEAVKSLKNDG
ncbi:hypothetical protein ACHAXT_005476 [Thalassiosira profunda]